MKNPIILLFCLLSTYGWAQSPGQIVRPAGGNGVTALNPNGDGYSSAGTTGFTSSDILQSEIAYKIIPVAVNEPTGDIATGPSGGFTDIVRSVDGSGFYVYSNGTNIYFRLRIGTVISGSKGYSALIDTDGKIGFAGTNADSNYVAATNTSNGNPGFEYEVQLQTNFQVVVYSIDGKVNPGSPVATYALASNSQISAALSTDGGTPDYFYDWYVPLSAIGSPATFRMAATTVTSPNSALQGSRSDVYGISDRGVSVADAWVAATNALPVISTANIGAGGAGVGPVCTAPPVVNGTVGIGTNIPVSGTWTALDASKPASAMVTLYKNNVAADSVKVSSGGAWNLAVPASATGDVFTARAIAAGESVSILSNSVVAGCTAIPAAPLMTCGSTKGLTGIIPAGTTINIYQVTTTNNSPTFTPMTTGLTYIANATDQTFNYYGSNTQTGNACQGQTGVLTTNTTYMMTTGNGGCTSAPTFVCVTGSNQNAWSYIATNTIAIGSPVYPFQTTITGTGAAGGQLLRLFVNNQYKTALTATGSTFSFSNLSLKAGDSLKIYAQTSGACMTVSATIRVSVYVQPPLITSNSAGNLLTSSTAVSGTASTPGATVTLYKGSPSTGVAAGTATVSSTGAWVVSGLTLGANETYYAVQSSGGTNSPGSQTATVLGPTAVLPVFGAPAYLDTVTAVTGTIAAFTGTVRLYLDSTFIGSATLNGGTTWSVPVNASYISKLYTGGVLTATAQGATSAESAMSASTATVTCSSPLQPVLTPVSTTVTTGQTVPFAVSNVETDAWYAVTDNAGGSYATSVYTTTASNFSMTSRPFNTTGTYNLKLSADKLTGCPPSTRSAVITVDNASLPVLFSGVSAKPVNGGAVVAWTVSNEQDIAFYQVERSSDCEHFQPAGIVPYREGVSAGKKYLFADSSILPAGRTCYRIRQVDKNGAFTYSAVTGIQTNQDVQWHVSPNPATEKINISFFSAKEQNAVVELMDMTGKVVYRQSRQLHPGNNAFTVSNLRAIARGSMVLRIVAGNEVQYKKLVIE